MGGEPDMKNDEMNDKPDDEASGETTIEHWWERQERIANDESISIDENMEKSMNAARSYQNYLTTYPGCGSMLVMEKLLHVLNDCNLGWVGGCLDPSNIIKVKKILHDADARLILGIMRYRNYTAEQAARTLADWKAQADNERMYNLKRL